MSWQVNYALENIQQNRKVTSAQHIRGDAIRITIQEQPDVIAVISADRAINEEIARQYYAEFPDMDFLCGYRKECAWEGGAISYLENNAIGWGNSSTLSSAIRDNNVNTSAHKDYFFSYRLIRQKRSVANIIREFDRVFTMTLVDGRTLRIGMIMEYEPTADAIRTFWDRFGRIDIAWHINPNGHPTQNAIDAGRELGCGVMKWDELRVLMER